jgi:RNA polymerase sigma-70 factor, ECF subfamily
MKLVNLHSHKRVQSDDIAAFESLFREFYAPLCRYALSFVGSMDVAEEIAQEFFYNYWRNRKQIKIKTTLRGYLYQSIRNNALKHLEHEAVKRRYARSQQELQSEGMETQSEALEAKELQKLIDETLQELPERCSLIFRMSRYEGLKYHEIARELSISVKTVEANMGKALQLFRVRLKKYREFAY